MNPNNYIGLIKMNSIKGNFIKAIILMSILHMCQIALSQEMKNNDDQLSQGLVGILYDDTNLSRPVSLWYLDNMDSKDVDWQSRNDFSAKWRGLIKAPVSGDVTFFAEADNGVQLKISDKQVLKGWEDGRSVIGSINLNKDKFYPVDLSYRQVNGSSYLRLYWAWENQEKIIIPREAITFSKDDESSIKAEYDQEMAIPIEKLEFDISTIMNIHTTEDLFQKQNSLIKLIFGNDGIPFERSPDSVKNDIFDQDFMSLSNLKRIDRLVIEMDWNLNSICYHFVPKRAAKKAIIYHQGHGGKFAEGISTIGALLENGYDVIAISMPLKGYNRKPIVDFTRFGKMMIVTHEQMSLLKPVSGHPIQYFLKPVITMVNYFDHLGFEQINMTGISGGGWTTTLSAAIDTRILKSYPVAGSLPFYLRSRDMHNQSTFGDYEQYVPDIYRIANYLDLYIMGAYGENRNQLQILNQFDSCCFGGTGYTSYVDLIKKQLKKIGKGKFDVFLDKSHREHKISEAALEVIFKDLQ
jgi:hypothetical protein